MSAEELVNVQISDRLREGDISVVYDEVRPGREGLYYAILAGSTSITGRGLILWRLPSVWLAMLSLAMTVTLTRRLFGVRISLMTLGLMSITFWSVWIGRTVMHVSLMPLMITSVLYATTRAFQARRQPVAGFWFALSGILLGLAQYAHITAWTLLVIPTGFTLSYSSS
jgi:4-amino-4-deoxy-L-arabinose transferase-like glycosyltransferase